MKKKYFKITEVFTPSQPANYTFVEREFVNKRLKRVLSTPGKQIIIYGHSGVGKTTLLRKKLKEEKLNYITTRCMSGMTLTDIIVDAFNQLETYYLPQKEINKGEKIGGGLSASYFGIKASLTAELSESKKQIAKRVVDLPISPQTLAKFLGMSKCGWVLEDYHKIKTEDKTLLSQIMKVFMDNSVDFPQLKIIALGAVNSAREVIQYDSEMKSRISEIEVPLMSDSQLMQILSLGEKLLKIEIPEYIKKRVVEYSNGLPAITHQLALLSCEENQIQETIKPYSNKSNKINLNTFDRVIREYLEENSDTYKSIFEKATKITNKRKYENPDDLLKIMLLFPKKEIPFYKIKDKLKIKDKKYKGNNLKKYLDELTTSERAEIIRFNKNSNSYYFNNPFIRAYCQCALREDLKKDMNETLLIQDINNLVLRELEIARDAFMEDYE